ncbi:GNAT family N-acetyltransferase [Paenibacillus sp. L3-i20]|uniref:GNAT family N-acetyltransferase n=1 Tax=Paenibacillus sp. L3-i20 TaxID=2905833 RepID=UPI001EDD496B|nr:GNAT family protein [Paenibacillus sp. L3-i20]GKU80206.1 N-acetyltransferase [Paenibacillus sp. L3-i20]
MITTSPVVLTGNKVQLLPMELHHSEGIYNAGNFPEVWSFVRTRVDSLESSSAYVHEALEQQNAIPYVIVDRETGQLIGCTRLFNISVPYKSLEIGSTWLTPSVWRTSTNTECKYLILKYCFETLGTIRVQLKTDSRNTRSQTAIERLGAVKEGYLRNHMILPDGYIRDSVVYSIIDRDWSDVKHRLETYLTL